jgi:CubicO group peptidase (beta-lactamase class C family)
MTRARSTFATMRPRASPRATALAALLTATGVSVGATACARGKPPVVVSAAKAEAADVHADTLGPFVAPLPEGPLLVSDPEPQGMDCKPLLKLTEFVRDEQAPILSVLVSRNGALVYELYTSGLTRDDAHYVWSVTKSVTSALVGIAIDRGLIKEGLDTPVATGFPREAFASQRDRQRFGKVTLRQVMNMSAIDAPVPPRDNNPRAEERLRHLLASPNRATFALSQPLLPEPGVSFQYTDVAPLVATGMLSYATGKTAFDFGQEALFGPLGFEHHEWMHEDPTGIDNGAYGLRLRPVDMQKLGLLFLRGGRWGAQQVVPQAWVDLSFKAVIASKAGGALDYGNYWWHSDFGDGWTAHMAMGLHGQRVAVFPSKGVVVTMTALGERERVLFEHVVRQVSASVSSDGPIERCDERVRNRLHQALTDVQRSSPRWPANAEPYSIPSVEPKEARHPFAPKP